MAFVKIEDKIKEMEAIIFPRTFEAFSSLLQQDSILLIKGKINTKDREGNGNNEIKIMADEIQVLDEAWLNAQSQKFNNLQAEDEAANKSENELKNEPENLNLSSASKSVAQKDEQAPSQPGVTAKKIYIKLNVDDEQKLRMLHRAVVASPATADEKSQVILVLVKSQIKLQFAYLSA
jgi:DNA polymerase III alpha subunit